MSYKVLLVAALLITIGTVLLKLRSAWVDAGVQQEQLTQTLQANKELTANLERLRQEAADKEKIMKERQQTIQQAQQELRRVQEILREVKNDAKDPCVNATVPVPVRDLLRDTSPTRDSSANSISVPVDPK